MKYIILYYIILLNLKMISKKGVKAFLNCTLLNLVNHIKTYFAIINIIIIVFFI